MINQQTENSVCRKIAAQIPYRIIEKQNKVSHPTIVQVKYRNLTTINRLRDRIAYKCQKVAEKTISSICKFDYEKAGLKEKVESAISLVKEGDRLHGINTESPTTNLALAFRVAVENSNQNSEKEKQIIDEKKE